MTEKLWQIEPSGPLRGDVTVRGAKNAVSKHMVAAMLGETPSTIGNAPDVGEVGITAGMLEHIGMTVERSGGDVTVVPGPVADPSVGKAFTGLNRIPILMLGPLLHLAGEAFVPLVGGDPIGRRPVDFHVDALRAFGAEVTHEADGIHARASRLVGTRVELPYPSVGATETVLLAAVRAQGKTVIRNAATEPEIIELALFLQRMGARISFAPDRRIVVEGVERLSGAQTRLDGDRIEAFSYLVAGLVTRGEVRVHGCPQDRLVTAITTLARMGAEFEITDDWIMASAPDGLSPAAVQTDTHPGFATCLGGPACRYHDTAALHSAVVRGVTKLRGGDVTMPDIRAGFSAVLAAAVAEGPSTLRGVHHIERGYHRPVEQFRALGLALREG